MTTRSFGSSWIFTWFSVIKLPISIEQSSFFAIFLNEKLAPNRKHLVYKCTDQVLSVAQIFR